jgi:CRP/FNR family transcriptional regulator, cyclic AMP receptor protein
MRHTARVGHAHQGLGRWPVGTLLALVSPASQAGLLGLGVERTYERGETLIRESERSTYVVLLCSAITKVTASIENGRTAFLGIKISGDVVGEMAALSGDLRCATVAACQAARVRLIQQEDFKRYLQDYPDAHLALTRVVMQRLRWADKRRIDFSGYPAYVRLARVLDELADGYGREVAGGITFDVELTQREFGALVGAEEDTARRELRRLCKQRVIRTGYRKVTIIDRSALRAIAYENDETR